MKQMGKIATPEKARQLLQELDCDGDNTIDFM